MPLGPGTRIGPYEIASAIGAGGMGEVYRARDTRLKRDVALKTLPAAFAHDQDRLARFRREANVLAALNHPHIAQIYSLEDAESVVALSMELVEGSTLADRIRQGPVPLDEAVRIAKQIADALGAAHDLGIVHRDLKPTNIKLKEDGTVKVLDFGLAKAVESVGASGDIVNSPTLTSPSMTRQGVVLGTAAYMAPEQARGRPVDKRADIWAFGVVLYEMLTGRRMFAGDDVTDTIATILKTQPDLNQVPAGVRRLLTRCLEKDPSRRLRDIGDAWDLLESPQAAADSAAASHRRRWLSNAGFVVSGVALGLLAWAAVGGRDSTGPLPIRFVDSLPEVRTVPHGVGFGSAVALAPDGRTLVYSARENAQLRLYRRFLGQLETESIGDVGAAEPFFSPDGQWVGFVVGTTLKRVSARGGPAETIAQLPEAPAPIRGISWHSDGTIVVGGIRALWRLSPGTSEVTTLLTAGNETTVFYPQLLPGGRAVLYTERTVGPGGNSTDHLLILDLQTGGTKRLLSGTGGRYLPSGHLVFGRANALWGAPFDIDRFELSGDAVPIVEGVRGDGATAAGGLQFAVADSGALAYMPGLMTQQRTLVWINRQGQEVPVGVEARAYASPRISPDGKRIAVAIRDEGLGLGFAAALTSMIWIWDVQRRVFRQLTTDPAPNWVAAWFPDGRRLAISASVKGVTEIHEQAADGSGVPRVLTKNAILSAISRDGTMLLFGEPTGVQWDIGVLPLADPKARRTLQPTPDIERNAVISPDARWLAYESDRSGRFEIYVRPFPNVESAEYKVTPEGGIAPVWARDGRELFYWNESGALVSIMSVPIASSTEFDFGASHRIAQGSYARPSWDTQYDVGPDGRFVLLKAAGPPPRDHIVTVLNWFEELKRLVPIK